MARRSKPTIDDELIGIIGDRSRFTAKLILFAHSTKQSAVHVYRCQMFRCTSSSAMDSVRVLPKQRSILDTSH